MSLKRRAFILLILIGFLMVPFRVRAVELTKTFENKLPLEYGVYALFPSYDNKENINGYVVIGWRGGCGPTSEDFVTKYNLNNEKVFSYVFNDHDIPFQVNHVTAGTVKSVLKDSSGSILWSREYGNGPVVNIFRYYADYDSEGNVDGYVVLLENHSKDIQGVNPGQVMIKYDKDGNLLWQKNYKFIYDSTSFFSKTVDYYVDYNGNYFSIDYGNKKIEYYSSNDELLWEKTISYYDDVNPSYMNNGDIDGVIVNYGKYFVKYDTVGNEVFMGQYSPLDNEYVWGGYAISSQNSDGNYDGYIYFFTTYFQTEKLYKTHLVKYDYQGNVVWSDTINNFDVSGIMESFDKDGKFNGYTLAVVKYDGDNSIGSYIMKYTYPKYDIVSDNDKGGVINVKDKALAGDVVKVEVKAKEGYVVKRIIVKDEDGNEIEVSSDGTFIMPEGKVTVSAIYERITNPDTVSASYIVLGIVLVISIGTIMILKRKKIKN